ncbi:MAG: hypothetical protein ACE5FU_09225 [Nitrospinota bacterium]
MSAAKRQIIYVPYMNDHARLFSAAFRAFGIEAETLPESTERSVETGRKYLTGKECLPMAVTLGDFIGKLETLGNPAKKDIYLLMPSADGPCRFGQYASLQQLILSEIGFSHVKILSPGSSNGYGSVEGPIPMKKIRKLIWTGIVAVDFLQKTLWTIRPYERVAGETEATYIQGLRDLEKCVEQNGKNLKYILRKVIGKFKKISVNSKTQKPVIGLVGEIFCRGNSVSNHNIVRKIEQFGGQALVSPMAEWFHYTSYLYKKTSVQNKEILDSFRAFKNILFQTFTEKSIEKVFYSEGLSLKEPPLQQILQNSLPYLNSSYRGEAALSIGKAIDMIESGRVGGVINVLPFSCMPGLITTAISKKVREDHNNFPWLNIDFDGADGQEISTTLEAFIHRVSVSSP